MTIHRRCGRRGPLLLGLAVALTACEEAAATGADQDEPAAGSERALYMGPESWPGGVVPVCLGPGIAADDDRVGAIRWVLEDTWAAAANVRFVGFGACDARAKESRVEVSFIAGRAHASRLGPGGSAATAVRLTIEKPLTGFTRYNIIHEFGHALGFIHEQQRPDFVAAGGDPTCPPVPHDSGNWAPISGGRYLTRFDRASVMSYCDGQPQNLTKDDEAGVAMVYGAPLSRPRSVERTIAWQAPDGKLHFWLLASGSAKLLTNLTLPQQLPSGYRAVATADLDADGLGDLVVRDDASGDTKIGYVNSGSLKRVVAVRDAPGRGWAVVAAGRFDGDAHADLLWRGPGGELAMMYYETPQQLTRVGNPGPGWSVAGVGDFGGDGIQDILLRDAAGDLRMWEGGRDQPPRLAGPGAPEGWTLAGIGDFDGNGRSEVVWRHRDGKVVLQSGSDVSTNRTVGSLGPAWAIAGVGDFDSDGQSDLLLRDHDGRVGAWLGGREERAVQVSQVPRDWVFVGSLLDRVF